MTTTKTTQKKTFYQTYELDYSKSIKLVFPGEPKAIQSFKVALRGKYIHKYQPSGNVEWKNYLKILTLQQLPEDFKMFSKETPIKVIANFFFSIPSSFPKKIKSGIENGRVFMFHVKKPDLADNLKKGLNDALTGVVWEDDRTICAEESSKQYSTTPRIELTIVPVKYKIFDKTEDYVPF